MAIYSGGNQLGWRQTGNLPSARFALRAALVDNVIHVTGGRNNEDKGLTSVLAWNSSSDSWEDVGHLAVARSEHAAVSSFDCLSVIGKAE